METKTGRLILLIFFNIINIFCKDARISYKIVSPKGIMIKNVIAGEPFQLEVTVHDANVIKSFNIDNLEQFKIQDLRRSTNQSIINGVKSEFKIFSYSLLAKNSGNFEIGPIMVEADGKVIKTEPIKIFVKDSDSNTPFKNSSDPEAHLKMIINSKNKIFVGQKVPLKIRFYYNSDDINCEAVSQINSENITLGSYFGPYEGLEKLDNQTFKYLEWIYFIYPKKSGRITIPPITSSYTVSRTDDMWSATLRMFGAAMDRKLIDSKQLSFQVFDIPDFPDFDGAIGKFTDFALTSSGTNFSQGSPIVLKLQIKGDGNFENLKWPKLNLPDFFRITESKNYFDSSDKKMTFEYIVQILRPGIFNIGPQKLIYFDPDIEKFKSLESNILTFSIEPSSVVFDYQDEIDKLLEKQEVKSDKKTENFYNLKFSVIPIKIFLILFFSLFIIFVFFIVYSIFIDNYQYIVRTVSKKFAFIRAKLRIKSAFRSGKTEQIYDGFDLLFRSRLPDNFQSGSAKEIENILNFKDYKKLSKEKNEQWKKFYLAVLATKFSKSSTNYPKEWIFTQAFYWVKELEKLI